MLAGCGTTGVHVHLKITVFSEQRDLTTSITPIGTVRLRVDQLSYREPVGHFLT
jgi:hypothetical protein